MDRHELVKQAYLEAWESYIAAMGELVKAKDLPFTTRDLIGLLADLSPMAAQIYRQLSTVTYIKIPVSYDRAMGELIAQVLEESGVNFVIVPNEVETTPTEDNGT